jgi:Domain of unknown function (DUF5666)/Putative binding domain, N-terminal/Viral BACON domain
MQCSAAVLLVRFRRRSFAALSACAFAAACGSTSTSVTAPSVTDARCQPSFDATPRSFGPGGGTSTVAVSVPRECSWSAASAAPWLAITSGAQGQGDGSIAFRIDSNPDPVSRSSAILIGNGRVDVSQQPGACRFDVVSPQGTVAAAGTTFTIEVRAHAVCEWSVAVETSWTAATPASGRGNGTISVTVAPNTGGERVGFVIAAGQRIPITQAAPSAPPPTPAPPAPPAPPPPAPTPTPTPTPPPPAPTPTPVPEEDVELSGRVFALSGQCPNLLFTVEGSVVVTNDATKFKGGKCDDIENGTRVRIKGRRQSTGIVVAREVER